MTPTGGCRRAASGSSYLVTAWTQRPEDEHRLLSALLVCFVRNAMLPPEQLDGPLAEPNLPVLHRRRPAAVAGPLASPTSGRRSAAS